MWAYFTTFLVALVGSVFLTPLAKSLGPRLGAMDIPSELSIHSSPIPRTGGLAMFGAMVLAAVFSSGRTGLYGQGDDVKLLGILISGAIVCGIGLLADVGKIPSRVEVAGLMLPASVIVIFGMRLKLIPSIGIPLTLFYVVGSSCGMNLLDGMDGLAAGVAGIAAVFFGVLSAGQGNALGVIVSVALLGSVLGFLPYNFHGARIFMGDVGSLFLGVMLGSLAVLCSSEPYSFAHFAAPVLILGVPVFDTFLAIVRRALNRRAVVSGDRRHLYDVVRTRGAGYTATVLAMYGLSLGGGATALIIGRIGTILALALTTFELALLCIGGKWLGAFEPD